MRSFPTYGISSGALVWTGDGASTLKQRRKTLPEFLAHKRLPSADKQFTLLNGISHASFQQKNYQMVYRILNAYFTQPAPAYMDTPSY